MTIKRSQIQHFGLSPIQLSGLSHIEEGEEPQEEATHPPQPDYPVPQAAPKHYHKKIKVEFDVIESALLSVL